MRPPTYKTTRRLGFNMTPMIDVVFLLIIFFLVSSHLARQESQVELQLPVASTGADDVDQAIARMIVNVNADGTLWLAGRPIASHQLAEAFRAAVDKDGQEVEVRIRGSRQAPYSAVEPIMLACTEAHIWNVTYAVYREEPR